MLRDNVSIPKPPEAGFKRGHCQGNIVGVHSLGYRSETKKVWAVTLQKSAITL